MRSQRDWFDRVLEATKLPDYIWHCNRHTFASRLVMNGVDLRTVGELFGHRTFQMTMRYAHLAADHKHEAVCRSRLLRRRMARSVFGRICVLKSSGSGEMADALGLGPSGDIRGGSSPFSRTR